MLKNRDTLILYSAATCNLNCVYCAIDKNPALQKIDKLLEESFQGDYYINFIKEVFPNPDQLTRVEVWGGETFLGLHRVLPTLKSIIENYPNFNSFFVSSNMTIPEWMNEFNQLVETFQSYPERKFSIQLQMSLDGTKEITDHNRGKGVTEKLTDTFHKLLTYLSTKKFENIEFRLHFKPTLTIDDINKYLQTEEQIIEYYKFFEQYLAAFHELKITSVEFGPTVPNTAVPSPHTQEDGLIFRDFAKRCYNIQERNKRSPIFQYYTDILPFHNRMKNGCTNCTVCGGMCGSGYNIVGLLPDHMISACHSGFANFLEEYKTNAKLHQQDLLTASIYESISASCLIFPYDKLENYENQIYNFYKNGSIALLTNLAAQIIMTASAGQIDHRYIKEDEAIRAANYIISHTANCIRDNLAVNGTITLMPIGLIRLLLNGARDYLDEGTYV